MPSKSFFPRKNFVLVREAKRDVSKIENAVCEISPAHSTLECYQYLYSPPEIEYPTKEYIQRNDNTPLPAENLTIHCRDLSIRANVEWYKWIKELQESTGKTIKELMLDESEMIRVTRYERVVKVEDARWLENNNSCAVRLLTETPGFTRTSVAKLQRAKYTPSQKEREHLAMLSDYQTNVWRKGVSFKDAHLVANCTFRDDPDYIPPSSGNGNFRIITPSSRMYNATFEITLTKEGKKQKILMSPDITKGKDYNTPSTIKYILKGNNIEVNEDDIVVKSCLYEYDLRFSRSDKPNPTDYDKVDTTSPNGMRIMQLLNEQPHVWKEFSWNYGDIKKVAFYFSLTNKNACFWVYLDDVHVKKGQSLTGRRKIFPRIDYEEFLSQDKTTHRLVARLMYNTALGNRIHKPVVEAKREELRLQDFVYVQSKDIHDIYGNTTELYVHRSALTKKDREKILLSESNWRSKYGAV